MTVPLPVRLRSVQALIPPACSAVADIGAGHGALCATLATRGRMRVIATEASAGPLAELRGNLEAWGMSGHVDVLWRGTDAAGPGEVDAAVVAGLGANTMLEIVSDARSRRVRWLILQCMQRDEMVVPWLDGRRWHVRASDVCVQRGRAYTARLVEVGE
ncbi:MAG: class I SAM-dependent methyltransferase [Candidatus Dormibacteraeota bacterium]|nr:class I SAM-dependent methyltransferase [Candidatus Dormibacteraeota bacterium]